MIKSIYFKFFPIFLMVATFSFLVTSCGDDDEPIIVEPKSIVETAQADEQFSILVDALIKADLVNIVNSGTFTVFAPTNTAFNKFFDEIGVSGLEDLDAAALTPILLYHVLGGSVKSTDLSNGYVGTASIGHSNQPIKLKVDVGTGVVLDKTTKVTTADVETTNGTIHIVDEVLTPPTVIDLVTENDDFSILVSALTRPDLDFDFLAFLSVVAEVTIFAPDNDAFVALLESNQAWNTLDDIDAATLEAVLQYHLVAGNFESTALTDGLVATTKNGEVVTINTTSGVKVTDAKGNVATVGLADVQGIDGVIHVINKVLLP